MTGAKQSFGLMRVHITINADGITKPSVEPTPPDGGAHIKRDNKSFVVTLSANPTALALSVLIRSLRVVETTMELDGKGAFNRGNYTRSQLCIMLSQMALNRRESEFAPYFTSRIEILTGGLLDIDILPQNLLRLGQLSLGSLDVPTALLRASEADIQNLVSIGQTMSMKLSFIARPENLIWPSQTPQLGETFEECLPRAAGEWLSTVFEAALAIRSPIYHHGLIKIDSFGQQPFQRLIYPLAPIHERSANHRVLSVACLTNEPNRHII